MDLSCENQTVTDELSGVSVEPQFRINHKSKVISQLTVTHSWIVNNPFGADIKSAYS